MSTVLLVAAGAVIAVFGGLVVTVAALCRASAVADEGDRSAIEAMLAELSRVESPSGRRFFHSPSARFDMVKDIASVQRTPPGRI